ncbi:MAG: hypothetical protein AMXMBFR83_24690 [Phycisphaerae bacterium]
MSRSVRCLTVCLLITGGVSAAAPLAPDELLLLYNAASGDSRELAEYYARSRGVPAERLLGLTFRTQGPQGEEITAEDYQRSIRDAVRAHLEKTGLRDRVRCLVNFYGLPLRVGMTRPTPVHARLLARWQSEYQAGLVELERINGQLNPATTRPTRRKDPRATPEMELARLREDYLKARQSAAEVVQRTPADQQATARLLEAMRAVEGLAGLVSQVELEPQVPGVSAAEFNAQLRRLINEKEARIRELLAKGLEDPGRDEARKLVREVRGLGGVLQSLAGDIEAVRPDETHAALDSELALLWYEGYPKYRWMPNPLGWRARRDLAAGGQKPPPGAPAVLMVGRIDGPTPAVARGLIDKALAAEKTGVAGTVYIDARGMASHTAGYYEYDEHLRRLAALLKSRTPLRVVLDNQGAVFPPGRCPDALLYCGWYSLRKYVDAFTFAPGAVAWHIASGEAISLKTPGEQGWCKRLLEEGATATLGPVAEPYLQAFPRPDDFFALLLTRRFTLAEVYAFTVPHQSWMMMLIGDPLYRPFAAKPLLTLEQAVPPEVIPPEFRAETRPAAP